VELSPFAGFGAIVLPAPLAQSIGVRKFGADVKIEIVGHVSHAPLYRQLSAKQIGPLIESPIVVAPLAFAQEMAGTGRRITRVLVATSHGSEAAVRLALVRLAGGRINVEPTGYDEQLFAKAAATSNQSTVLFAVISALVGFLFAFNAMSRDRATAPAADSGPAPRRVYPRAVVGVLFFDALALGVIACLLGLSWAIKSRLICFAAIRATSLRPSPSARRGSSASRALWWLCSAACSPRSWPC